MDWITAHPTPSIACLVMAVFILLIIYSTCRISEKPTPCQQRETTADLISRLELEPGIQTLEVRADQSVQVVDAKGSSYGLEIGPAIVLIIKRHEPVEPVSELIGA